MTAITAAILPNGRTVFFGPSGQLAGGNVYYYIPSTTMAKTTWQDPEQGAANVNPVPLDANGSALIYGAGQYRQVVFDANGTQIDDSLTYGLVPSATMNAGFGAQMDLASAATTDLGTVPSQNVLVTGTVNIGSFGDSASLAAPIYYVEFDGELQIANSANIICPGGASFEVDSGSGMLVEFLGAGIWKIIAFFPSEGAFPYFGEQMQLASAGTTDLGTIATNNVLVTGTTTINSFGTSAGERAPIFLVEFNSALTLTNSGSQVLIGGANISAQSGDSCMMLYNGGGEWTMLSYTRVSGYALRGSYLQTDSYVSAGVYTWTPPFGARIADGEVVGAGGGAGGAYTGASDKTANGSGGGGGGGYTRGTFGASAQTVTVGAGGAGGVGNANGVAGGASSIGTTLACNGGALGSPGTPNASAGIGSLGAPGNGGVVTTAGNVVSARGGSGHYGIGQNNGFAMGGNGGGSFFGSGVQGATAAYGATNNGSQGNGPGTAGAGAAAYSNGSGLSANGGAGADGAVIIRSYT